MSLFFLGDLDPRPVAKDDKKGVYVDSFIMKILLIVSCILAAIFIRFPQIDLFVSSLFFTDSFELRHHPVAEFLNSLSSYLVFLVIGGSAILFFASFCKKGYLYNRKKLIYIVLVFAIGPGLVVNVIFKDHFGRARPLTVKEFGGSKNFTPPFVLSDQCERNCSFTAGDPSVGFAFFAFYFLATKRKKAAFIFTMSLGGIFGITRIVQGAHFLSDVIYTGIFVYLTAYILYYLMDVNNKWHRKYFLKTIT